MSGYYPDDMTQASFDRYWMEREIADVESGACCKHMVSSKERCPDCDEESFCIHGVCAYERCYECWPVETELELEDDDND